MGFKLHFPTLDVDLYVPALVAGIFGTRAWMTRVGADGRARHVTGEGGGRAGEWGEGRATAEERNGLIRVSSGPLSVMIFRNGHDPPHFHVFGADVSAKFTIADTTLLSSNGRLRRWDIRAIEQWGQRHKNALYLNWELARAAGSSPWKPRPTATP